MRLAAAEFWVSHLELELARFRLVTSVVERLDSEMEGANEYVLGTGRLFVRAGDTHTVFRMEER